MGIISVDKKVSKDISEYVFDCLAKQVLFDFVGDQVRQIKK